MTQRFRGGDLRKAFQPESGNGPFAVRSASGDDVTVMALRAQ
jgi:hypothetical protein